MKKFHVLLIIMFMHLSVLGINDYSIGDTLYVIAKTGLNLRINPDSESGILHTIPFGEELITKEGKAPIFWFNTDSIQIIETQNWYKANDNKSEPYWIKGKWVKVNYKEFEGYVFDAYLSKFKLPNLEKHDAFNFLGNFIKDSFELEDSISTKFGLDQEYSRTRLIYNSGCVIEHQRIPNSGWVTVYIYDFSVEEIMLVLKYIDENNKNNEEGDPLYLLKANDNERNYYFYGEMSSVEIKVTGSLMTIIFNSWC